MRKQNTPVRFDKFDPSKVVIEKPQKNAMVDSQLISYPRYEGGQLLIQTPMMKIVSGGMPSADSKYHLDPKSRANNIKIPFDPENSDAMILYNKLVKLDEILDSDEFRMNTFGKIDQHSAQLNVRQPMDMGDYDDDSKKKISPRFNYIKARLALDIDGDNINVKTGVFQKDENGKHVKLITDTVDDFAKYIRYQSNVRFVLMANKFYTTKNKDPKTKKYTYGMTFKIQQIEVEASKTNAKYDFDTPNFDDEDNEVEQVAENVANITFNPIDEDEEGLDKIDDLDNIEEDDDVPLVAPPKKSKKKVAVA